MKKLPKPRNKIILAYQHEATELRYVGTSSNEIAHQLFIKYGYKGSGSAVRHWFSTGGVLEQYYREYADEKNAEKKQLAADVFTANLDKAQGALAQVMAGQPNFGAAQVMAAKEWLDRGMGKVVDKAIILTGDVRTFAEWAEKQQEEIDAETEQQTTKVSEGSD